MMTIPKKISAILLAMEAGIELKLRSGHTLAMSENDEPGFVMFDRNGKPKDVLFQVGSDEAYMLLIQHAKDTNEEEIKALEDSLRNGG